MKKAVLVLLILLLLPASLALAQPYPEPDAAIAAPAREPKPRPRRRVRRPKPKPAVKHTGKLVVLDAKALEPDLENKKIEVTSLDPIEVAVEGEKESYTGVVIKHLINLGFLLLSLLLSGLITVLLKKLGFEAKNDKVQEVLKKSTAFAEQWAIRKAKVSGEPKPGGPAKMDTAIGFALDLAREYKLPMKGREWWEDQLESWLGMKAK